ncbi:N(4)-(Beta-N-acetylglucosaminyl)-L-asparaginase [Culex quinquefasciatus]|uniref:N(4)-(beta-N-acetylglucosaminyl)-L-asparaginase n=1 Tax=Culex quinquefasciatus TaxID=7176 RepID=B0WLL7_CULQU|nr:N(4)-(Beta-N-acetylglucosaminyl)-L-asparaginase [Culex quinquefasciatus]|eukprot:XP_001849601.1 N(4)-(Beta-N-acetylglucosaminyl)-L-asparaginase [Culex quinquefasciatus]
MASPRRILLLVAAVLIQAHRTDQALPLVINTWAFTNATLRAHQWLVVGEAGPIDALVEGCSVCEREQCDGTVGYGGSPDENGETTLDAMIMDGSTMNIGAMGFKRESLETERSKEMWEQWKNNHCQPNFWQNVIPSPSMSCGPYEPISGNAIPQNHWTSNELNEDNNAPTFNRFNHDTIGMIVIDAEGHVVAGTSTNGARNKIPGRVGDSPIPGSGAYADSTVGAAAATGDGDIMMRFMPSLLAVEGLRRGLSPVQAGETALARIALHYPKFVGGIVVASSDGQYGAACHGMDEFPYSVAEGSKETEVVVKKVKCSTKRR